MAGRTTSARFSTWSIVACMVVLVVMRAVALTPNEISWDVFGYYLYLPATFIHHDPLLHDTAWITEAMQRYHTTGTLYQLSNAPDNSTPMYFFLMGMAICYLPFFLIGHAAAWISGSAMDGFSMPYQVCLAMGALTYTFIGLLFVRRILRHFLTDRTSALVLLLIVFGTNLLQFATAKNLETANFLFCMVAVMVWNTIRWHADQRRANLLWIAGSIALITLIKPSEIVCGLVPLFWGVHDKASLRAKWRSLLAHRMDLVLALVLGLCLLAPQMLYWHKLTGGFVYDSYKNPGVGLDLLRPHIADSLFSFRKGWLIYTPLMLLAIAGLVPLYRQHRSVFGALLAYVLVSFYIIASWSEWWYGASFSIRPMISLYPLLAIPLALSVQWILDRPLPMRVAGIALLTLLVAWNGFQLWQFRNWILHPYRTTKAYYFAVLGSTSIPSGAEQLLSAEWSFDGTEKMGPASGFQQGPRAVLERKDRVVLDTLNGRSGFVLDGSDPYGPAWEIPYEQVSRSEYVWVKAAVDIRTWGPLDGQPPCIVFCMERKEGSYGYRTVCLDEPATAGWSRLEGSYMTPPIRDERDRLKVYLWHRGNTPILVDSMEVTTFIPKRP